MLSIDEQAEHGITLGAANFLRKPVNTDALAREVAALLNGRNELLRVLLVEDDAQLRGYLRRTLEHNGWVVQEAGDGLSALELFTQERPDLAIIDLMLPVMDGITLIRRLRTMPAGDTLPILVVTARELSPEELAELNRSVEQVLRKGTFHGEDLVRSTWALIEWQRKLRTAGRVYENSDSRRGGQRGDPRDLTELPQPIRL